MGKHVELHQTVRMIGNAKNINNGLEYISRTCATHACATNRAIYDIMISYYYRQYGQRTEYNIIAYRVRDAYRIIIILCDT